jgi:serine protease AprX
MTVFASPRAARAQRALLIPALSLALGGTAAHAGGLAPDLARRVQADPQSSRLARVIVRFSGTEIDDETLSRSFGGRKLARLGLVNGAAVELPERLLKLLSERADVLHVSPDRDVQACWDQDTAAIGADQVWLATGVRGSGPRVAVLDTGVYQPNDDLNHWGAPGSRVVAWKDFVNGRATPYDDNGHGTHVAGVALGSGTQSTLPGLGYGFFSGVAPAAELVAVKVLDKEGRGTVSAVIAGIEWCVQRRSLYNIRIINLSLGQCPRESYRTDPLCAAVRQAVQAGIVVVCSAGNMGKNHKGETAYGGISCPGNEPSAITVGALNTKETVARSDDSVCTFSSRGPTYIDHLAKPDLVAPGNNIVSLRAARSKLDRTLPGNRVAATALEYAGTMPYFRLSGTSMAAPQVAGTAALMLAANESLTPNAVKALLMYTAQRLQLRDAQGQLLSPGLSILTQGAGSLNTVGAVELALGVDGSAGVGRAWRRTTPQPSTWIGGEEVAWCQQILWGDHVLWGDGLMRTKQVLWSDGVLWGDNVLRGDTVLWTDTVLWADHSVATESILWGDNVLWGDSRPWGDSILWGDLSRQTLVGGE